KACSRSRRRPPHVHGPTPYFLDAAKIRADGAPAPIMLVCRFAARLVVGRCALVAKLSRSGTDHLPYDLPGYPQLPADRFDGLALLKKRAADLCNRLHDQHPNLGFQESWKPMWTLCAGVPIGSRSPRKGGPFCMPIHNEPTEDDIEIGRLARLPLLDYERERIGAAARLGVRAVRDAVQKQPAKEAKSGDYSSRLSAVMMSMAAPSGVEGQPGTQELPRVSHCNLAARWNPLRPALLRDSHGSPQATPARRVSRRRFFAAREQRRCRAAT